MSHRAKTVNADAVLRRQRRTTVPSQTSVTRGNARGAPAASARVAARAIAKPNAKRYDPSCKAHGPLTNLKIIGRRRIFHITVVAHRHVIAYVFRAAGFIVRNANGETLSVYEPKSQGAPGPAPIPMVLHCPECGVDHRYAREGRHVAVSTARGAARMIHEFEIIVHKLPGTVDGLDAMLDAIRTYFMVHKVEDGRYLVVIAPARHAHRVTITQPVKIRKGVR